MENVISRIRSILAGRSFEIIFLESTKMKKKKNLFCYHLVVVNFQLLKNSFIILNY